jgi:hypothetical protein
MLLGLRLLAYDHAYFAAVQAALTFSPSCAPCYLDIRPGRTGMDEVMPLLDAHANLVIETLLMSQEGIPDLSQASVISIQFQHLESPFFLEGWVETAYSVRLVNWIRLTTTLTLGDVWLALGQPPEVAVYDTFQVARYDHFSAQTPTACGRFWEMPVEIIITDRRTPPPKLHPRAMRRIACELAQNP